MVYEFFTEEIEIITTPAKNDKLITNWKFWKTLKNKNHSVMELIFIVVVIEYTSLHGTFPRRMLGWQKFGNLVTISEMFLSFCHFINFFKTF